MTITIDGTAGVTFPDTSVQPKSSYGPAFSAYQSTLQSVPNATPTKIQFQTKEFDTNTAYDNVTNYRFQPTVAGYYQMSGSVGVATSTANFVNSIYKNGARFKDSTLAGNAANATYSVQVSALVYLNGSTDYVELWTSQSSGGALNTTATNYQTYFQGIFIRGA